MHAPTSTPRSTRIIQSAERGEDWRWCYIDETYLTRPGYTGSTSIFFESGSSFTILKLRICPALSGSLFAAGAGALPFHRACSIDESDERSTFALPLVSAAPKAALPTIRQPIEMPFAQFHRSATVETPGPRVPDTTSPTLCSAMYSSMLVGMSCFMLSLIWRFSVSMASTCAFTTCPARSTSCGWMIQPSIGDDLADVNQALDAVGDLHKCAEIHQLRHRPLDLRTDWKLPRNLRPRIGKRLFEPERDPPSPPA